MQRRDFITLLGGAAAAWPLAVRAQHSGRIPVVGSLWSAADAETAASRRLPLLRGLAELGYIPGKTIILEERYANEVPERFDALASELVNLKVDVLVGAGGSSIWALHRATSTIPTVFVAVSDPVAQHLASSFSKPGGNLSGITQMSFISPQSVCSSFRRRFRLYRIWLYSVTPKIPVPLLNYLSSPPQRES